MRKENIFIRTYLTILERKRNCIHNFDYLMAADLRRVERILLNYRFDGIDNDDTSITSRYFKFEYNSILLNETINQIYKNIELNEETLTLISPLIKLNLNLIRIEKIKKLNQKNLYIL